MIKTLIKSVVLQGFAMKKDPVGDTTGLVHFHLQLLGFLLEIGHLLLGLGRPQLHTSPFVKNLEYLLKNGNQTKGRIKLMQIIVIIKLLHFCVFGQTQRSPSRLCMSPSILEDRYGISCTCLCLPGLLLAGVRVIHRIVLLKLHRLHLLFYRVHLLCKSDVKSIKIYIC